LSGSFFLLEERQALGAVPLALGLCDQVHAAKVEPLDGAVGVVAANHLAVRHLKARLYNVPSLQLMLEQIELEQGARKLTGENLKVVWAKVSTLS